MPNPDRHRAPKARTKVQPGSNKSKTSVPKLDDFDDRPNGSVLDGGPAVPEGQQPQQIVEHVSEGGGPEVPARVGKEPAESDSHERGVGPVRQRPAAPEVGCPKAPKRRLATITFVCVCSQPRKTSSSAIPDARATPRMVMTEVERAQGRSMRRRGA